VSQRLTALRAAKPQEVSKLEAPPTDVGGSVKVHLQVRYLLSHWIASFNWLSAFWTALSASSR
jgi:hypothetical protein